MDFEALSLLMREAGIVGAGGAGFPSYAKLNKSVDTLIINCAECEPLLRLHRQLMERKTKEILEAVNVLREALGVKTTKIALKKTYTKTIASLNACLGEYPDISLALLPEVYPAGDEVILIYEATGRVVPPLKIPSSVGVVVYNTETMYNLYRALHGKKVTHKYVTVTGEVNEPHTFYAPIGSLIYGLVKRSGGLTIDNPSYLIGGPMMGRIGHDMEVVTKTTNAIIVLPSNHNVVIRKRNNINIDISRVMSSCCLCHTCTDLCPRHNLGHPIDPSKIMRAVAHMDSKNIKPFIDSYTCSSCGLCEMFSCPQGLSPRTIIAEIKKNLRNNGVKPLVYENPEVLKDRDLKRVPLKRLRGRLNLEKYNNPASIYLDPINAKEVDIPLNQHIGVPSIPVVKVGDKVKEGDLIAKYDESKLGVNIHASIDGEVIFVDNKMIKIRGIKL